jgi:hypothetical protein
LFENTVLILVEQKCFIVKRNPCHIDTYTYMYICYCFSIRSCRIQQWKQARYTYIQIRTKQN